MSGTSKATQQVNETADEKSLLSKTQQFVPPPGPRRSSSRSIKRPKFDDELVDTNTSAVKRASSSRRQGAESVSSASSDIIHTSTKKNTVKQTSSKQPPKKKSKKIKPMPVPTDFGRWRPTDDLTLISAVTQTCDLQIVHLAVRFSCRFSLKEIQDRWFALLYDPFVSRLAQQSMKQLPADVVEEILNNVLWSREEDCTLSDFGMEGKATIGDFQRLLDENRQIFHKCRTATMLRDHWQLLCHYNLLSLQPPKNNLPSSQTLAEMESMVTDELIDRTEDDSLNQERTLFDRRHKREITRLEMEIPQWETLIENCGHVNGFKTSEFTPEALAVLKGRILKYCIAKKQVIIGRNCYDLDVDIDLSIEGPSLKISRQQGLILYEDGVFYLENCGKRTFYINGFPLATGQSARLVNDTMIEICCIKLMFLINTTHSVNLEEHKLFADVKKSLRGQTN